MASFSQIEETIAWRRLFGFSLKGAAASKKVEHILPSPALVSFSEGNSTQQKVEHLLPSAAVASISVRCKTPFSWCQFCRISILASLRTLLEFKAHRVEVCSAANFSLFAKTIAWRLFGFCLIGRASRVEDVLPAAGTSLVIKFWHNSSPFDSCLDCTTRFASRQLTRFSFKFLRSQQLISATSRRRLPWKCQDLV